MFRCLAFLLCFLPAFSLAGVKFKTRETIVSNDVRLIADYGAFRIYETSASHANSFANLRGFTILDTDTLKLDHFPINTQEPAAAVPAELNWDLLNHGSGSLRLIQFAAPIKAEWLDEIRATGAIPVHYIADNGYLIWADNRAQASLDRLVASSGLLQFHGAYLPHYKLGTNLLNRALAGIERSENPLKITVQIYNHPNSKDSEVILDSLIEARFSDWTPILNYKNAVVEVRADVIPVIASLPDVYWVGERAKRGLHDEVQAQILAGELDNDASGPSGTGYLDWLMERGLSDNPADYPVLDVVDDGVGVGETNSGDPTFHRFGLDSEASRVMFIENCTSLSSGAGVNGHGHINWSIAMGFDDRSGFPYQDDDGYRRGLGINPFGRGSSTRIFGNGYDISQCGGSDSGVIQQSYRNGARLSTNSWGCSGCAYQYDDSSQAYDVGIRDADSAEPGNQQFPHFFSAGNSGSSSGTIGTPGNGKNMITVGASENDRSTWTDGCGIGPSGADDAMDVIYFSSRGPAPGGRVKPEVIAPGTHIQGTASTYPGFTGNSVCDANEPGNQSVFAASSGTSHSTPAVAGMGSIIYYVLQNLLLVEHGQADYQPSPSMIKAFLIAHAGTYLTGASANDTLPSNVQGYGMPHLGQALELETSRLLVDEPTRFDNTGEEAIWSGSVADPSKAVRIVLAYTDAAGAIGTSPQVNDLDLEVTVNGNTYLGNHFEGAFSVSGGSADTANNYEAVFLPAGTVGTIEIRVIASNIGGDGVPNVGDDTDQDFSIATYNVAQHPDFYMIPSLRSAQICAPDTVTYEVQALSVLGFAESINLSFNNIPSGVEAQIEPTTLVAGENASIQLTLTDAAEAGSFQLNLEATSTTGTKSYAFQLDLSTQTPSPITPMSPTNGAAGMPLEPLLQWQADEQAHQYHWQVSLNDSFQVIRQEGFTTASELTLPRLAAMTTYFWRVRAENHCGEGSFGEVFSFTTDDVPNFFTEQFSASDFDLQNSELFFFPTESSSGYSLCVNEGIQSYPVNPSVGTTLSLSDDSYSGISLTANQSFPFYGTHYDTLYVGSNGYITFGNGDRTYSESLNRHFQLPRISGVFDDLWPGNNVSYIQLSDRLVVTWDQVTEFGTSNSNSFQIALYFDGRIQITYLDIALNDGIVGLSSGDGLPAEFQESDLSVGTCGVRITSNNVCVENDFDIAVFVEEPISEAVTLSLSGVPEGTEVSISPNPVDVGGSATIHVTGGTLDPGLNSWTLVARSTHVTREIPFQFRGYQGVAAPQLMEPLDGASDVYIYPQLSWEVDANAFEYLVEVATDPSFETLVLEAFVVEPFLEMSTALQPVTTYYWRVSSSNICGSDVSSTQSFETQEIPNFFTRYYENASVMSNHLLEFTPSDTVHGYALCVDDLEELPYDPQEGTELVFSLDDYDAISVSAVGGITFYGTTYDTMYVGSNGYVTFGSGDTTYDDNYGSHFARPRVSLFFDDLNLPYGGSVRYAFADDAVVVTWFEVPEYGLTSQSTGQIIFYHDGRLALAYGQVEVTYGTVGLSQGNGLSPLFVPSDMLSGVDCYCPGDFNDDGQIDGSDWGIGLEAWHGPSTNREVIIDGRVDISDLLMLMAIQGPACED